MKIPLGICVEMVYNIMLPLMTLTFILLNILLYVLILVSSTCFFLVFINSDVAHLFLSLDLRNNLILLTMFARLTCLVYFIGCKVSLYLGYSAYEGIGLIHV